MKELKPCPFCGMRASIAVDRVGKFHQKKMYIYCHGCGLRFDWDSLPLSNDVSIEEYNYKKGSLIKRWNRRTKY